MPAMVAMDVVVYAVIVLAVWAVLFLVQIPLRKSDRRALRTVIFVLKLVLLALVTYLFMVYVSYVTYVFRDEFAALYLALCGDILASIIGFVVGKARGRQPKDQLLLTGVLSVALTCCVFAYGVVNSNTVQEQAHTYALEGVTQEHTFVFMSDLHTGTCQTFETLEGVVESINAACPDFVILGGDVTDEMTSADEMQRTYQILSGINAPTYFIYGNHDRQIDSQYLGGRTYTDEELEATIEAAGITILKDEYVQIADDLVLLGREDISAEDSRVAWSDLSNPYSGGLIVADHQPLDDEQLDLEQATVQVSGHTHAGQLFPLQTISNLVGVPAYGDYQFGDVQLMVSPGESGWGFPLRTEEHCTWDLVTVTPK